MKNFDVREITKEQAKSIITAYHYLHDKLFRMSYVYGLFYFEQLVGVIVFHSPSAPETVVGAFGLKRTEQGGGVSLRLVD